MTDLPVPVPAPAPPRPGGLQLRGVDGSIRPGWAVLLFVALAGVAFLAEMALSMLLLGRVLGALRLGDPVGWALISARAAWAASVTWVCCRVVDWRFGDAYLRDARWPVRLGQGVALGTGAFCLVVLVPLALGHERFSASTEGAGTLAAGFLWTALTCGGIAISEEMLVRGFALRQLERGIGRIGAAAATSVAFGLLHVLNPNASWLAIANITLVGLWLAVTVQRTGSLWLATGVHFAWNLTQAFVWGEPVSGFPVRASLLVRGAPGDELWTGGDFGPEASIAATAVMGLLAAATLAWDRRVPRTARPGPDPLV